MALKFLYITIDAFVNESEEFVRILAVSGFPPVSGSGYTFSGQLFDPSGNAVSAFEVSNSSVSTDSAPYPYALAGTYPSTRIIIIPPGWSFQYFILSLRAVFLRTITRSSDSRSIVNAHKRINRATTSILNGVYCPCSHQKISELT